MERGQRRTPQQTRTGQPQRRPAQSSRTSRPTQPTRPATRKRKKNKSKKPWIIGAAVVLLVIIVGTFGGGDKEAVTANDTSAQTPTSTPTEQPSEESIIKFGELLSVTENLPDKKICVVKVKISSSYNNQATVDQNYYNIEHLIKNCGFDKYEELQYWAVADMTDGSESKVFSCTVSKTLMDSILNGSIAASEYGTYVDDLWILPSLT